MQYKLMSRKKMWKWQNFLHKIKGLITSVRKGELETLVRKKNIFSLVGISFKTYVHYLTATKFTNNLGPIV